MSELEFKTSELNTFTQLTSCEAIINNVCWESLWLIPGALAILPTILYLTTGVIKETATKNIHDPTVMANTVPVTSALHCLRTLATDRYCKEEKSAEEWQKLLQSALAKVIDLAKTGEFSVSLETIIIIPFGEQD